MNQTCPDCRIGVITGSSVCSHCGKAAPGLLEKQAGSPVLRAESSLADSDSTVQLRRTRVSSPRQDEDQLAAWKAVKRVVRKSPLDLQRIFEASHPDYRIEKYLGRGATSIVFLAIHKRLHRKVAIKILAPEASLSKDGRVRFEREARALARLEHPAIVPVYDLVELNGLSCIVMGFAEGGSLKRRLRKHGPLKETEVAKIGMQTALGLWAAAQEGIVHRDVKPDNLLVGSHNEVKIADFGLVSAAEDTTGITSENDVLGTLAFMSPEQCRNSKSVDHRSDLYSLGCTMVQLLAGKPPFLGPSTINYVEQHLMEEPDLSDIQASLPMRTILAKMLRKNPDERYQTGEELARMLAPLAGLPGSSPSGLNWGWGKKALRQRKKATKSAGVNPEPGVLERRPVEMACFGTGEAASEPPLPPSRGRYPRLQWFFLGAFSMALLGGLLERFEGDPERVDSWEAPGDMEPFSGHPWKTPRAMCEQSHSLLSINRWLLWQLHERWEGVRTSSAEDRGHAQETAGRGSFESGNFQTAGVRFLRAALYYEIAIRAILADKDPQKTLEQASARSAFSDIPDRDLQPEGVFSEISRLMVDSVD